MAELVPGIHLVDNSIGCNTYIIIDSGITLVDTGLRGNEKNIYGCLQKLGYTPKDIRRIIITHAHIDHINCLYRLKSDSGAQVFAGAAEADMIEGRKPLHAAGGLFGIFSGIMRIYYRYRPVNVDVKLREGDNIDVLDGLKVITLSGHSEGNLGLYSPQHSLVFSSDTIRVLDGRLAAPNPKFTADMAEAIDAIKRLSGLSFDIMLPGHGKPILSGASEKVRELYHEMKH
ncbi:MAG TPA: MBL fold metallo-hydrolase [Methanocella sp.]|uniref:MBL fold metallo-hydrolase n=1 Tax=Methanocella sp. TaxID=2052833 RepID=UPI002CCC8F94|nr:MBL fold metallo-hydrolase [Methanocella sp.]HTY89852.1 MBL fold metallo-hydrolase [Methanocella sp.]